jgi:hypothetical protein
VRREVPPRLPAATTDTSLIATRGVQGSGPGYADQLSQDGLAPLPFATKAAHG